MTSTKWTEGDPVVYCIRQAGWNKTIPYRLDINELIKWDYTQVKSNNWTTGIVWRTNLKQADGTGPGEGWRASGIEVSGNVGLVRSTGEDKYYAYDLTTGKQLWVKQLDYPDMSIYPNIPTGLHYAWDSAVMKIHAYDVKIGTEAWVSDSIGEYPWGSNNIGVCGYAYGNVYMGAYDGFVTPLDALTGKVVWRSRVAEQTSETVFNSWAPWAGMVIADGKVYISTSEHSPTNPRIRGNKIIAIDANSGKVLWTLSGAITFYSGCPAIAQGVYAGVSEEDGVMYAIGKGRTELTVSAPQTAVPKGTNVLIQGTVMDMSRAQPNTPAVADESMVDWMNYLHMQNATLNQSPPTPKGVPVILTTTAPDGSNVNIGTVTTDGYGYFQLNWSPPNPGNYKIQATFAGTESYWSSTAQTGLAVTTAAATSPSPTGSTAPQTGAQPPVALYVGLASIIIVIVIAVAALMLRRRK